jgi:hypothetical protein
MEQVVLSLAKEFHNKGHIYFVDAAARVVKSFENVEFIYVGDAP